MHHYTLISVVHYYIDASLHTHLCCALLHRCITTHSSLWMKLNWIGQWMFLWPQRDVMHLMWRTNRRTGRTLWVCLVSRSSDSGSLHSSWRKAPALSSSGSVLPPEPARKPQHVRCYSTSWPLSSFTSANDMLPLITATHYYWYHSTRCIALTLYIMREMYYKLKWETLMEV